MRARAVIVDDDAPARECIEAALAGMPSVEVVGSCATRADAVATLRREAPDLVFLDIHLGDGDGFDVLRSVAGECDPAVVFVTGDEDQALRAFGVAAVDYVVKPFDDPRLREATQRALDRRTPDREDPGAGTAAATAATATALGDLQAEVGRLRERIEAPWIRRIGIHDQGTTRYVALRDVRWFAADGNYVRVVTTSREHLVRVPLANLLERLDPQEWARIHRSTVVRIDEVRALEPWAGGDLIAILHDGKTLRVSRRYKARLLDAAL